MIIRLVFLISFLMLMPCACAMQEELLLGHPFSEFKTIVKLDDSVVDEKVCICRKQPNDVFQAIKNGCDFCCEFFIKESKDFDQMHPEEGTPLCFAVRNDRYKVVQYLIQCKADINKKSYPGSWTALHEAVCSSDTALCLLLIRHGADETTTADGHSLFHLAAQHANEKMISFLITLPFVLKTSLLTSKDLKKILTSKDLKKIFEMDTKLHKQIKIMMLCLKCLNKKAPKYIIFMILSYCFNPTRINYEDPKHYIQCQMACEDNNRCTPYDYGNEEIKKMLEPYL